MPLYQFRCEACKHVVEVLQSIFDPFPFCENCDYNMRMEKVFLSPPSVQFRGHGFYTTDVNQMESTTWPKAEIIDRKEYARHGSRARAKRRIPLNNV